jgi:chemotaxis regulatin CheY-phosphate phosphatase CheZ
MHRIYFCEHADQERQETANLQFSMVLGRDTRRLHETLRALSFDKHPIELGRDFS